MLLYYLSADTEAQARSPNWPRFVRDGGLKVGFEDILLNVFGRDAQSEIGHYDLDGVDVSFAIRKRQRQLFALDPYRSVGVTELNSIVDEVGKKDPDLVTVAFDSRQIIH